MNAQNAEKHLWVIKKDMSVDCVCSLWKEYREENLVDSVAISIINGFCVNNPVNRLNLINTWDMARKIVKAKEAELK